MKYVIFAMTALSLMFSVGAVAEPIGADGYLIVDNVATDHGRNPGLYPMVCPPNFYSVRYENGSVVCTDSDGKNTRPVSPQQALDLAYGQHKARVIGLGAIATVEVSGAFGVSSSNSEINTVIYFQRVAP